MEGRRDGGTGQAEVEWRASLNEILLVPSDDFGITRPPSALFPLSLRDRQQLFPFDSLYPFLAQSGRVSGDRDNLDRHVLGFILLQKRNGYHSKLKSYAYK